MNGFESVVQLLVALTSFVVGPDGVEVGRWLVALVFAVSGAAKLHRPRLAALSLLDFGVVSRASTAYGRLLGGAELALGLWIASGIFAPVALSVAGGLFIVFTALLARALRDNRSFPCFCLGDSTSAISKAALVRACLLGLGAFVWSFRLWSSTDPESASGLTHLTAALSTFSIVYLASRVPRLLGSAENTGLV